MPKTELLIRLRDLHEELSGINVDLKESEQVDKETIDALGHLATEVDKLVDQANEFNETDAIVDVQRDLLDQVASFETNHPRVTAFLTQTIDLLAMMGI